MVFVVVFLHVEGLHPDQVEVPQVLREPWHDDGRVLLYLHPKNRQVGLQRVQLRFVLSGNGHVEHILPALGLGAGRLLVHEDQVDVIFGKVGGNAAEAVGVPLGVEAEVGVLVITEILGSRKVEEGAGEPHHFSKVK